MKPDLKAKFLQHLNQKKQDAGFTLIELLVVIIIIGILAAIALPSFLSQAAKGRGAEAKSNVGAMNRAQQAYYLENQNFTSDLTSLGLGFPPSTNNFSYTISAATPKVSAINYGKPTSPDVKGYTGGVFYAAQTTTVALCEAAAPGPTGAGDPTSSAACAGTDKLIK